jgi:hypothetical protein
MMFFLQMAVIAFVFIVGLVEAQTLNNGSLVQSGTLNYCADAGANDTYACNLSPALPGYTTGASYSFKANTANTGAASINFNGLGALTIKKVAGGITTDLADNDIRAGQVVEVQYDGTNAQMQSLLGNAGGGSGDVTGGSVSVDGELAAYNSTTGKIIKQSFAAFSGPATSVKTYTLPNATTTILTTNALITVGQGGTGASTLTGIVQGNAASAFTALTSSTVGQVLRVTAADTFAFGAVDLADTDAVTGLLVVANGGSGVGTLTGVLKGNGTAAFSAATVGTDYGTPDASAKTFTNTTIDCEATGNDCGTVSKIILDFASCVNGAAFNSWDDADGAVVEPTAACNDTGTLKRATADFSGSAVNTVMRTIKLPSDWASGKAVDIIIRYVSTAATPAGNVEFDISTICRTVGETWDAAFNTAQTITDAQVAQNTLNDATQTSVTMTTCAAGEDLTIQVSRDGVNDTSNDLANALYLELTLRRTQ